MTTENLDGVMRRIEKLLAIAADDRANPNEAASAAAMAEKIMRKYQLEHADIIMHSLKAGDDLETADFIASAKTNGTKVLAVPLWASSIAAQVAKFTDCGARQNTTKNGEACVRFYGFSADVQVAKFMIDYLVSTVLRLCNDFKKTDAYKIGGRKEVNTYRMGVSIGICKKLAELIAEKAMETATATGTALVVVKQQAITEKYGDFNYKSKNFKAGHSFSKGVADGKVVDVTRRAIGSSVSEPLKLTS